MPSVPRTEQIPKSKGAFSGQQERCGQGLSPCQTPLRPLERRPATYLASGAAAAAGGCQSSVTGLFRSAPKASSRQRSPALTGGVFATVAKINDRPEPDARYVGSRDW
jgi:hypothetical protein